MNGWKHEWKRAAWEVAQRVLAAATLILLSPLLLVIALLVRLSSPGPVVYSQLRPGLNRKMFRIYKFRTMAAGSDKVRSLQLAVKRSEPRVTPVGRLLRELKLDELPQLWNIVIGDMNFVGPRAVGPTLDEFLAEKIPGFTNRYRVRPGLTNLGQVCIDDNSENILDDWQLRREAEAHYIENWSLRYDALIILMTAIFILRRATAYDRRPVVAA